MCQRHDPLRDLLDKDPQSNILPLLLLIGAIYCIKHSFLSEDLFIMRSIYFCYEAVPCEVVDFHVSRGVPFSSYKMMKIGTHPMLHRGSYMSLALRYHTRIPSCCRKQILYPLHAYTYDPRCRPHLALEGVNSARDACFTTILKVQISSSRSLLRSFFPP